MKYQFSGNSPVTELCLSPGCGLETGVREALIPVDGMQEANGKFLRETLSKIGAQSYLDTASGKPALRVVGFKDAEALIGALQEAGLAKGAPHQSAEAQDKPEARTLWQKFRGNTLVLSGWAYQVGNAFALLSGGINYKAATTDKQLKAAKFDIGTGIAFSAGDIALCFGGKSPQHVQETLERRLIRHAEAEGWALSENLQRLKERNTERGTAKKAGDLLRDQAINIKSGAEIIAGGTTVGAALSEKPEHGVPLKPGEKGPLYKAGAGASLIAGWLAGAAIDEKKPDDVRQEDQMRAAGHNLPERGLVGGAVEAVRRQPLLISGTASLVQNALNVKYALAKRQQGAAKKLWVIPIAQAAAMATGNGLYAISSKRGDTSAAKSITERMVTLSANEVLAQPAADQQAAIGSLAKILSESPEIDLNPIEARNALSEKLTALKAHPMYQPDAAVTITSTAPVPSQFVEKAPTVPAGVLAAGSRFAEAEQQHALHA